MRKNKSKKYSVIKYKGLEEEMSLLGFFCKKVVGAFAFEVIISIVKFAPEGTGYRAKTRFARFFNLPELISLFKESADIQTSDMLNLPVPEAEYINEVIKPSEIQKSMVERFAERAEMVRSGGVDATIDNMLKIVRC